MSIYLFSRPVHSGKTTELQQWCNQQKNVYGILMPDINGSRKILDLHTKDIFDIECTDTANTTEHLTSVGKFHFYSSAFDKANCIISAALTQNPKWLVIDEAGKLELDGKGFYAAIKQSVDLFKNSNISGSLLLTVRDSLCADIIKRFGLEDCTVVDRLDEVI